RSGRLRWRLTLRRSPIGPNAYHLGGIPILGGPAVVVAFPNSDIEDPMEGNPTTKLVAIDPPAGTVLWRLTLQTETARPYLVAFPVIAGRTVFLFHGRHELDALDARTGAARWRAHVDEGAITPGNRILVSGPGRVTALSRSGATLWSTSTPTGAG